jgi:hypothetical protein
VDRQMARREQDQLPEPVPTLTDDTDTEASLEEAATDEVTEEAPEEEVAEEETEDKEEPVSEDEEHEDSEEEAEQEVEEEPEEAAYTITVDGKQVEVTLDELKRGHLRESDYTRKTQDLATEREGVSTQKEHYSQQIDAVAVIMESALKASGDELAQFNEMSQQDWEKLQQEDAYEFGQKYGQFQVALQKRTALEEQAGQLVSAQHQLQAERQQVVLAEQKQLLIAAIPDMADVKAGPILEKKILTYATETLGLSAEEANGIVDHRVVIALNKARLYDELDTKVKTVGKKKRSKAPVKTVKAGAPQSKSSGSSKHVDALFAKARRTGSPDDMVEARLARRNAK